MALKELDRSPAEYLWVMETWLGVPGLSAPEVAMIQTFKTSVEKGLADFDQLRRIASQPAFKPVLRSAMFKAAMAGVLFNWSEYPYHDQAA